MTSRFGGETALERGVTNGRAVPAIVVEKLTRRFGTFVAVDDVSFEVAPRDWIHAERGLVEQQDLGFVDQRARQPELLLHATGELAGKPVLERAEIREPEQTLQAGRALVPRHTIKVGVEVQVLEHREVGVKAEALRHIGDPVLHRLGVAHHAEALQVGVALGRTQHARQHPQQGGLAGAIGTDQAEQLTGTDGEVRVVHRQHVSETARERTHRDGGGGLTSGHLATRAGTLSATAAPRMTHRFPNASRTSAGMPGLRSNASSPATWTFTA